ncbi:MAG: TIGR03617 family F420-dependent LLM class oxidoreductase [Candidatus Binataceae bacterium]
MKLDTTLHTQHLRDVPGAARATEAAGFAGLWTQETGNDGLLPLVLAAEHTEKINLGTAIAVAFPRSPMSMAYVAWDLAGMSKGRFILGLGTQVKGHNERRFSVKWDAPVPRLREYIESLRAIFKCWSEGGKRLSYRGKFYNFSLMPPFFTPPAHDYPNIPIYVAGVNKQICRLAGELCDGFHAHPFHSAKYLRESVIPNVETGLAKAGRQRKDFSIYTSIFAIVGRNDEELAKGREAARSQIAFYGSTRTYQPVLDAHGWGDTCARLGEKAAKGNWDAMAAEITDDMLEVFAVTGTFDNIAGKIKQRYEGLLDRFAFYFPYQPGTDDEQWLPIIKEFNG